MVVAPRSIIVSHDGSVSCSSSAYAVSSRPASASVGSSSPVDRKPVVRCPSAAATRSTSALRHLLTAVLRHQAEGEGAHVRGLGPARRVTRRAGRTPPARPDAPARPARGRPRRCPTSTPIDLTDAGQRGRRAMEVRRGDLGLVGRGEGPEVGQLEVGLEPLTPVKTAVPQVLLVIARLGMPGHARRVPGLRGRPGGVVDPGPRRRPGLPAAATRRRTPGRGPTGH